MNATEHSDEIRYTTGDHAALLPGAGARAAAESSAMKHPPPGCFPETTMTKAAWSLR